MEEGVEADIEVEEEDWDIHLVAGEEVLTLHRDDANFYCRLHIEGGSFEYG